MFAFVVGGAYSKEGMVGDISICGFDMTILILILILTKSLILILFCVCACTD